MRPQGKVGTENTEADGGKEEGQISMAFEPRCIYVGFKKFPRNSPSSLCCGLPGQQCLRLLCVCFPLSQFGFCFLCTASKESKMGCSQLYRFCTYTSSRKHAATTPVYLFWSFLNPSSLWAKSMRCPHHYINLLLPSLLPVFFYTS